MTFDPAAAVDRYNDLLDDRENFLTLCVHHDGRRWWAVVGVDVPEGACATEFVAVWRSFESRDDACKAAIAAGLAIRMADPSQFPV
jgi:hypothetical protein